MSLIPVPKVQITDADVASALGRAVRIIDPLLDVLWESDPLGLKRRPADDAADGVLDNVQDAVAWVLNAADVPGTDAWDDMDVDARINWWVRRVGAVNNVLVAYPGVLGALGDRLPIQDLFGFANQAIVLCAVAREHGITDDQQQVRLLAAVLCRRELSVDGKPVPAEATEVERTPMDLGKRVWRVVGLMGAISDELARRPKPRSLYRYLGMLPAIGAVVDYLGEYGALSRAAKAGRRWIAEHPKVLVS